ncbi:neurofilament medium [Phyllostomus discolor]|uniref:Neurofilament medium n=1 Tax=Phyllostomus discolor TaxID=89673 RepID=A0A833ZR97_9CHIR|nr:neurofilament medium [Phyllostomus discolor]
MNFEARSGKWPVICENTRISSTSRWLWILRSLRTENSWKVKRPDSAHFQEASLDHSTHTDSPPSQYPARFRKPRWRLPS